MNAPELTTERLLLRMLTVNDFDEYADIHMDPDVTLYTARMQFTRLDAWRHLAMIVGHWELRGYGMWGVFEKDTGALAGRVGFYNPDTWPAFELGWTIGKKFWGKGYASEAARRCLDYAFNELDREHVISLIDPENIASIRVAEAIGETLEGEAQVAGHRSLMYGISRPRKPAGVSPDGPDTAPDETSAAGGRDARPPRSSSRPWGGRPARKPSGVSPDGKGPDTASDETSAASGRDARPTRLGGGRPARKPAGVTPDGKGADTAPDETSAASGRDARPPRPGV